MSGNTNKADASISSHHLLALYTHCASHFLNLALVASFEEVSVHNMIGVINWLSIFSLLTLSTSRNQKRLYTTLNQNQVYTSSKIFAGPDGLRELMLLTRSRHFTPPLSLVLSAFQLKLLACILLTLCWQSSQQNLSELLWSSMDVNSTSGALLLAFKRKPKTVSRQCLRSTPWHHPSSKWERESIDSYHGRWFETISEMCSEVGTTPSMPRVCGCQHHSASTPPPNPSAYYRRTIPIPILDHLLAELNRQFSSHQKTILQGLYLVPSVLVTEKLLTVSSVVMEVAELLYML